MRLRKIFLACLVALLATSAFAKAEGPSTDPSASPNIILINLDDVSWDAAVPPGNYGNFQHFPNLNHLFESGITFKNYHVTTPLCGPSRASLLTGQYAFKTDVRANSGRNAKSKGFPGGYQEFMSHGAFRDRSLPYVYDHLGTWLQDAGYRTMHVGRYLHEGFGPTPGQSWAGMHPPGWDEFYNSLGNLYFGTTRYLSGSTEEGLDRSDIDQLDPEKYVGYESYLDFTNQSNNYRTNVEIVDVMRLIHYHEDNFDAPFFVQLAPLATHATQWGSSMVDVPLRNWWTLSRVPNAPDLNELDMSDKPSHLQALPIRELESLDGRFRNRMLAMKSFDIMLGALVNELAELGLLDSTYLFVTSDNGYQLGHHRMIGKVMPYDRCTRVPLVVCPPGSLVDEPVSQVKNHLVANIDLAPTILEIAQAPIPEDVDGRSITELLDPEDNSSAPNWRTSGILLENYEDVIFYTEATGNQKVFGTFNALRLHDQVYVEWANGSKEYYDLAEDPFQLENSFGELDSSFQKDLRDQLIALKANIPAPRSFVSEPLYDQQAFCEGVEVSGFAEAAGGVGQVRLVISDVTNAPSERLYWNGDSWQEDFFQLLTELDNTDGPVSRWSYPFELDEGPRRIRFAARCYESGTGAFEEPPAQVFANGFVQEQCAAITSPRPYDVIHHVPPIVLQGWSDATAGVSQARLVIYNIDTDMFWNGTDWQTDRVQNQAVLLSPGAQQTDWYYAFDPPSPGFFWVSAKTYDVNGDWGYSVHWMTFETK